MALINDLRSTSDRPTAAASTRFNRRWLIEPLINISAGAWRPRPQGSGDSPRRRVMDLLIAAIAQAHEATLYTRNTEDLRGLDDLVDIVSV